MDILDIERHYTLIYSNMMRFQDLEENSIVYER